MDKKLNLKAKTIKILEESTGIKLHDTGFKNEISWIWHEKHSCQKKN